MAKNRIETVEKVDNASPPDASSDKSTSVDASYSGYNPPVDDFFRGQRPSAVVEELARQLASDGDLTDHEQILIRGACLANDPKAFYPSASLSEQISLMNEIDHRFKQPFAVWFVSIVNAMAAIVQGMDETVTSGAQLYYLQEFGLQDSAVLTGFLNSSPYLACSVLGCWLSVPFNNAIGRRGTIFVFCILAIAASIWEAVSPSWQVFLGARLVLGISIGAKSATVAVYTAECTPVAIRGGLVMFWQVFVAFGIMLGFLMGVAFVNVSYPLNWRLMMGCSFVAPLIVMLLVYLGPESPRYYVIKGRYAKAFKALQRLRFNDLQAARDLFYIVEANKVEQELRTGRNIWSDIRDVCTVPRVRYAALSSWIIMFMQNFCGINAITYYTGTIFVSTGVDPKTAIYTSFGAGALNFLFALPVIKYIDTVGRRPLLMCSLLSMAIFLLWTGFSFYAQDSHLRLALVAIGIYMYEVSYSPGQGPVPFVYASEAFPLYLRTLGMSFATATTWFFGFVLGLSWPSQLNAMGPTGAFGFYAAFSVVGAIVVYFVVPETCGRSLEELDVVFSLPIRVHAGYQWRSLLRFFRLRSDSPEDLRALERENHAALMSEAHVGTFQEMGKKSA